MPCSCDDRSTDALAGYGSEGGYPLGALPVPVGLADLAEDVAAWLGIDLSDLLESGADALLEFIGITSCSDENKAKYRRTVRDATPAQLQAWLLARRVGGATGNCNKFALAIAAKKAAEEARKRPPGAKDPLTDAGRIRNLQTLLRSCVADRTEAYAKVVEMQRTIAQLRKELAAAQEDGPGGLVGGLVGAVAGFAAGRATGNRGSRGRR